MRLKLISFDAAGTLIQVREPVGETYAACARRHGAAVTATAVKAAFRSLWGRVPPPFWPEGQRSGDDDRGWWHDFARRVFAEARGVEMEARQFDPLFDELYRHYADPAAWVVYDDVAPALEALGQDQEMCVLSNFDRRLVRILEGHGLRPYFRHIILSSEAGAAKPHPRMFQAALRLHGVRAEECLHVGDDDLCDIQGAHANGWQAFSVKRPESGLVELVEKVRAKHIPACICSKNE